MRNLYLWPATLCALLVFTFSAPVFGQATDGNLVGTVTDATGAVVQNATVQLENRSKGLSFKTTADNNGLYRFNNVPVGFYALNVSATGFSSTQLQNVEVALNRTSTANLVLQVGTVTTTVEVSEAASLIDTTTAQIQSTFQARQAIDLPSAIQALGVLNLALLSAGVSSSGGLGLGEGPSVGGQRPRNNSFNVEGVDNNRKDVTGHNVDVPNEAVAEFTVLQNQFSAEFGHAGGGQFNTVIKGGTNEFHGSIYEYLRNRKLNALDESFRRQGTLEKTRYDDNVLGATFGGPIRKDKLFFFGNYQYEPFGQAGTQAAASYAPTAQGYQTLSSLPGVSQTNLGVLKQYLSPAATASDSTTVGGASIPIGILPINFPAYQNSYIWLVSADYNISESDQLRSRYVSNKITGIDPNVSPLLPAFAQNRDTTSKLFSLSEFHTFTPSLTNELRLAYSRFNDTIPAGDYQFPGLDMFPNITIENDLNVQLGPFSDSPQSTILNTYQIIDNVNWTRGRHALKFGGEGRKYIAPTNFIQRVRGDYGYKTLERYLLDLSPNVLAERNLGGVPYSGNQTNVYWFVNDSFRIRPNLSVNLGLRHEYKGVPAGDNLQALNSVSSVPGILEFRAPRAQKWNFAPRVGIAYSPGQKGLTSIRAGFGMAYDNYFDNLGTLSKPPQLETTVDDDPAATIPNYLKNGGISPSRRPDALPPDVAKSVTSAYIADQHLPYSIQWNVGIQHVFGQNYTLESRYVGTRGVRLFVQDRINSLARVTADRSLPTYLQQPSQGSLDALPLTLDDLQASPRFVPRFAAAGYDQQPIVVFANRGNSIYHGWQNELTRRFSHGVLFKTAYTWSHNIDDSTADLFSTLLSPRRAQDFQNWRAERASSFIDRRHRFTFNWVWDVPWYRDSGNWLQRNVLGNFTVAGVYTIESPQYATVQSNLDSNLNGDSAGDRAIVNPGGDPNLGSDVTALTNSAGKVVAYLADNPAARYIVAGPGAYPNAGRQTIPLRRINNFDLSLIKRVNITESKRLEVRAAIFNTLNHPQYIAGSLSTVRAVSSNTTRNFLVPGNDLFNDPTRVFSSNARNIVLGARLTF